MNRFHVIGGTYVDEVYWVDSEIDHDVSLTAVSHERTTGGPGACLAVALARLGGDVVLTTALGDGEDTARASEVLKAEGVEVRGVRHRGPLDRSVTLVTPSLESVTVTHRTLAPLRAAPADTALGTDTLVVCSPTRLSSLVPLLPGPRLVLAPHLTQCRELLAMRAAERSALLAATDLLVANEREHRLLEGLPGLDALPALAITRGDRGSSLRIAGTVLDQVAHTDPQNPARNPNGAGEAFTAALLTALASGRPARWAQRAAALHAARHITGRDSFSFPDGGLLDPDRTHRRETEHAHG